jgi:hypothetical protein
MSIADLERSPHKKITVASRFLFPDGARHETGPPFVKHGDVYTPARAMAVPPVRDHGTFSAGQNQQA